MGIHDKGKGSLILSEVFTKVLDIYIVTQQISRKNKLDNDIQGSGSRSNLC